MQEAQETRVRSLGWDDPLEEEMAPHSSIPAWKTPWTEALGGLQSLGFRRVVHSWASKHAGTGIAKTVLKTEVGGLIPHSVNCGCVIETASGTRDSGETGPHHMAVIRRCRGVHRERMVFLNLIEVLLFMMFHCFWCWVLLYVMFTLIAQLVKNPPAVQGDPGSIPGSGRSPGEGIGHPLQYSWASFVAQLVKNPPAMQETWVQSLGWEDPGEGKGYPLQYSDLANSLDCIVHGVAKSWTRLSDFNFHYFHWVKSYLPNVDKYHYTISKSHIY